MSLKDKIAIVTGASRGLGRHIALKLAAEGIKVAICARSSHELEAVENEIASAGGKALSYSMDLANHDDIRAFVATVNKVWGPADILVNNAGIGWYKAFDKWTTEEIDIALQVNLHGLIHMTHAVLPKMLSQKSGQIINIASDLSRRPLANMAVYTAAKHGVLGFAHSLLREVKNDGVKVTTITPGIIDTYFGGGTEGSREESWALRPEVVADQIVAILKLPKHVVIDEMAIHPMEQDF